MKRTLCLFLALILAVGICFSAPVTITASAADSVSYVDYTWDEESKTLSSETKSVDTYTEITSTTTEMTSGWYVVNGEVTVAERMTATGEVHLILVDGAHLTASEGITVNEGNSLYIYGQSSDENTMGKLTATTTTDYDAAIGSLKANHAGTIVINGGNINASAFASGDGAGIGSAGKRGGYQITINAGVVTATSGNSSAAIGSGNNGGYGVRGTVHSICINGGVVNATVTANGGAAIGGGSSFDGGDITITGGTVTATNEDEGAAIGGGKYGSGGNITITGGNVTATYTHSVYYGVAIGAGYYGESAGNILITGGTVTATSTRGCGIGVYNGDNGRIVILGGTVNASGSGTVHINAGASGSMMLVDGTTVTISGDFTLQTDFVLPEGYTLEISEGATLTIPEGVTLTLPEEYTLVSNGTVNAVGTVNCITHKYVEGVCICGLECSHVGGTPTCTAPAVCTICGTAYGEVDPTNHNWENGVCTYGCNTIHEPHDWSGKDSICTVCGATCTHTGGEATCTEKAVCTICGASYGDFAPHTYENGKGKCTVANCDNACAHEIITDGDCVACGGKHCGNTENDKVVWFCDATDDAPGDENDETLSILTITGSGDLAGYTFGGAPWEAYRESIRGIDIKDGVTSIGIGTFCGCVSLTSVIIPGSVKIIGDNAFSGCEKLSNVRISDGVISIGDDVFKECIALKEITIPESVTEIGEHAFNSCTMLMTITIPQNVTVIGEGAFCNCTRLTEINVDEGNTTYSSEDGVLFNEGKTELICCPAGKVGDYEVPSGVTSISNYAFSSRGEIFTVTIPVSVTTIGDFAFAGSQYVNLIVEPGSDAHTYAKTKSIPYIFNGCITEEETAQIEKLTFTEIRNDNEVIAYSVTGYDTPISGGLIIPETYKGKPVTEIGSNAFNDCSSLTSVIIPESIATISADAFNGCGNVTLIVELGSIAHIYAKDKKIKYVFKGCTEEESAQIKKLTFTKNSGGESYSVTFCDKEISGALNIPAIYNGKPVTEIGAEAFVTCTELTSVTIPESVTTIGENAFANCDTLNSVEILGNVTIIGAHTFEYCTSLSSITIPESVTTIGENAFAYCNNLSSITIPEGVTTIGDKAFSNCTKLETVTIGENVTTIGDGAFADCSSLSSVIIPNSVTTIGKNAFDSCTNLESVTIGENVGKIDDGTFSNCTSLETIRIPDSVKTIGAYAFYKCKNLESVTIGKAVETIGSNAFRDCSLLKEIVIPDSVTTIGNYAFDKCISLGTAIIGNEVKTIGESAFGNCVNLKSLTIGKAVETIGELAFQQCPLLTEIVIPASVKEIGENALIGCSGLKYIFFEGAEEAQKDVADSIGIATNVHYGSSTHTFNENYTVDTEPTCTKKGSESQHCKYCDLTRNSRDVKEKGHTSVNGGKIDVHTKCNVCGVTLSAEHEFTKTVIKAPTCTSQGVETWACECGYSETNNVEESDHNFVNHDGKVATCTEDGYYPYQTCTTCDYTTYHVDPAKGHDIVIDKAVEATCTKTGLTEGSHCTRCNDKTVKQNVIPTKAHTEVTVTGKAATCTANGLTDGKKCSVCGVTTVEQKVIAATGHTITVVGKKDATTKDAGYTGDKVCSVCNAEIEKGKEIPKIIVSLATPTVTIKNTAKGIEVNWNAIENAESYIVYRSIYNASTKKWSKWGTIKTGVTETSFVDGTVKLGTSYKYTVRAVNGDVKSSYVGTKALKYNIIPTVKIANTATGVKVAWSTAANATGYTVYSSTYNTKTKKWSGWKNRGTAKATATSWVDKNATKSGAYYKYTVRACNGKDIKSSYNKDGVKTLFLATPTVKIANNAKGVKVTWNKITGSKGYIIYRSEINNGKWSNWKNMGTVKNTILSWVDKNAQSGTTYRYTVRAVNGNYKSAYKASGSLIFLSQPTVKVANASNGIKVSWNKVDGVTGYTVYSSTYDAKTKKWSSWKNRGTAKANKTSWVDKNVKSGVKYKYTVRAVNGKTRSTYVSSSALLYLAQPTVTVKATSNGINVSWTQCAGSNGYTVYRSELVNGEWSNWTNMGTAKSDKKSWTDKKAKKGVTYKYTVRAVNGKVKSSYKSSSSITK